MENKKEECRREEKVIFWRKQALSQIRYSLVVILELNGVSEVQ